MSKRGLSSVTRRFFLKAGSVGGAIGAVAATGVGAFLEACSGGSFTGGNGSCTYGDSQGAGLGYGSAYGNGTAYGSAYGCNGPSSSSPYGGGGYGYGSGGYGYGGGGYGYGYGGTGIGYGGYGYGGYGYGDPGYGYGGYGYGGYGYGAYGYGGYGYGYGYGASRMNDPSRDEQDTALRLGLAPERVGPAQRIRV
jgi:hypothetical protein